VRIMLRPMRPKPLIPTLMSMLPPIRDEKSAGRCVENAPQSRTRNAMGSVGKSQTGDERARAGRTQNESAIS
jgi:hypothetical protein